MRNFIAVIALALFLNGCMGRLERPNIPTVIPGAYTLAQYNADLASYTSSTGETARVVRNRIVHEVMAETDYAFYNYEAALFLNQGRFHVGSDFLQLGLAAGATVSNGARAKTILSALLSGVTGTSLSVDKNFFREQTVQAIASSMEASRDRVKTVILQELLEDVNAYPFAQARADLIKYFFAGTLSSGLQQLHQESAAGARTAQANLQQMQVGNISAADVSSAGSLNRAVTQAFAAGDLSKVTVWLRAMKAVTAETPTRETIEQAVRELGRKVATEPALRQQYFNEARKAGLIE